MAQFARPNSDNSVAGWIPYPTGTVRYSMINEEVANDNNYIRSTGSSSAYKAGLTGVNDPFSSSGHTVVARARATGSSAGERLTVELYEDTTLIATPISSQAVTRNAWNNYSGTLTGAEADAIGDYTHLYLRYTSPTMATNERVEVSWSYLQVPDITPVNINLSAATISAEGKSISAAVPIIISIDHETGNKTQYDGESDPDGDLLVTGSAALAGTNYGLLCNFDDDVAFYEYKDITTSSRIIEVRFYADLDNLTALGDIRPIFIWGNASGENLLGTQFGHPASVNDIHAYCRADDFSWIETDNAELGPGEHCIEVQIIGASTTDATDGSMKLWVDGNLIDTVTGINNYDFFGSTYRLEVGAHYCYGNTGVLYLDEIVLNTTGDYIGAKSTTINLNAATISATGKNITVSPFALREDGARDFNGSTDRVDWSNKFNPLGVGATISVWLNLDDLVADYRYMFCAHQAGNNAYGVVFYLTYVDATHYRLMLEVNGSTVLLLGTSPSTPRLLSELIGNWHNFIATWDGTTNPSNGHLYLDGTIVDDGAGQTGVSLSAISGSFSVGGRIYDDGRNIDGKIGEVAVWNRILSAGEISTISSRSDLKSGNNISSGLEFCVHPDEPKDLVTNETGTYDGTSLTLGPDLSYSSAETILLGVAQINASGQDITIDSGGASPITINLDAANVSSSGKQLGVGGDIYYVAKDGDNGHPGTLAEPWLTVTYACTQLSAGDRLYIRSGTYQEEPDMTISGTESAPIIISGYPGETAIIDGNGMTIPADEFSSLLYVSGDYVTVQDIEFSNSGGNALTMVGNNCTAHGIYAHDCYGSGITIQGNNGVIDWCLVYHCSLVNEFCEGADNGFGISICRYPTSGTIRHCTVWNTWGEGISTFESSNVTIEDCISYNNLQNFYLSDTQHSIMQRNFSYYTPGNLCRGYGVSQNAFLLGDEVGGSYASHSNTFINNIAYGGERNFAVGDNADGLIVSNNTFVNAAGTFGGGEDANVYFFGPTRTNSYFENNIIRQDDDTLIAKADAYGMTYDYNCWTSLPIVGLRGANDIVDDPLLEETDNYTNPLWYKLQVGSPCRGEGIALASVDDDYWETSRSDPPDIGAHEYIYVYIYLGPAQISSSGRPIIISAGVTHYVDFTNGDDDTHDGLSEAQAWKTISKVNGHTFSPGESCKFKRGEKWRETLIIGQSGESGSPITYGAYGTGTNPVICGAEIDTTWTLFTGSVWQSSVTNDPRVVLFDGVAGNQMASLGSVDSQYDYFWESGTLYVYSSGGNPNTVYTNPGVEVGTRDRAITNNDVSDIDYINLEDITIYGVGGDTWARAVELEYCNHWNIDGLTIEKCGVWSAIYGLSPTYLTISNCSILGIRSLLNADSYGSNGIQITAVNDVDLVQHILVEYVTSNYWTYNGVHVMGYSDDARATDVIVRYGDFSHCASGIYYEYMNGGEIHDNVCDDNLIGGYADAEQYGIAHQTVSNVETYNNVCTNGSECMEVWGYIGAEFPLSGLCEYDKIHHNIFAHGAVNGFLIYEGACVGLELHTNLIYDNAQAGIHIGEYNTASTGCSVYNNTCYGNGSAEPDWGADFVGNYALAGWTVKNNIFSNTNRFCWFSAVATSLVHSNNCFYRTSGNPIYVNGTQYDMAHVTDFEATAVAADPKFISVGDENFDIQSDSPCIGEGVDVGLTEDYDYRPIVGVPDIGAYEYQLSISLSVASLLAGGKSLTVSLPSGATINLQAANVTTSGKILTVQKGAVSLSLGLATVTSSGKILTIQKGAVSIDLDAASLLASGLQFTIQKGAVTIGLDPAILISLGKSITVSAAGFPVTINFSAATLAALGKPIILQPGAVSLALNPALLASYGKNITLSGASIVGLSVARIITSAPQSDIQTGEVSIGLDTALVYVNGQIMFVSSSTPLNPFLCLPK